MVLSPDFINVWITILFLIVNIKVDLNYFSIQNIDQDLLLHVIGVCGCTFSQVITVMWESRSTKTFAEYKCDIMIQMLFKEFNEILINMSSYY